MQNFRHNIDLLALCSTFLMRKIKIQCGVFFQNILILSFQSTGNPRKRIHLQVANEKENYWCFVLPRTQWQLYAGLAGIPAVSGDKDFWSVAEFNWKKTKVITLSRTPYIRQEKERRWSLAARIQVHNCPSVHQGEYITYMPH